ncbi:MAG: hypothetical protein Q8R55_07020 [Candidatus Taylorbacteria bacterium]|nr:hypothetical protein [Candidatus Taylorbacteria bacterium]
MMVTRTAMVLLLTFCMTAFQLEAQDGKKIGGAVQPDHDHQTYLKGGLVHTESEMEGFNIIVNGLSVDLETYFNRNHIGLSGWFVGYRKDNIRFADFGHLLNAGVFRTINTPVADMKLAGGLEWGVTSPNYNRTRFSYEDDRLVSYEHLFLQKNTDIPGLGPAHDSALYPFLEASILKRWEWFLVEAGVRGNVQKFGFDRYRLDGDNVEFVPSDRTRIVPAFFIKFGVVIF